MARYELTEVSFIDGKICQVGEIVEMDDSAIPGPHMIPVDKAAKKAVEENPQAMKQADLFAGTEILAGSGSVFEPEPTSKSEEEIRAEVRAEVRTEMAAGKVAPAQADSAEPKAPKKAKG